MILYKEEFLASRVEVFLRNNAFMVNRLLISWAFDSATFVAIERPIFLSTAITKNKLQVTTGRAADKCIYGDI